LNGNGCADAVPAATVDANNKTPSNLVFMAASPWTDLPSATR
jgi:hypothetical protein